MPWKETCPMDQRMEFVIQHRSGTISMAALCRLFGVSRQTGHKWVNRFSPRRGEASLEELSVMDAASRFLLACTALRAPEGAPTRMVFEELFRKHGLPKAIRCDNGEPFVASRAPAGLSRLSAWWVKLGIRLERIDPGEPQQNGRHERMHLTLKIETALPPKATFDAQSHAFDRFRRIYNLVRPHEALAMRTPASKIGR